MTGSILVLCRGNLARSPIAATLLESRLLDTQVQIASAGLSAERGRPASEVMASLAPRGVSRRLQAFESRPVSAEMIQSADLVLTATRHQRAETVQRVVSALTKTFTLREFAALAQEIDSKARQDRTAITSVSELVALVPAVRGLRTLADGEFDVPDPYGRSKRTNRRAYAMIDDAVTVLADVLTRVRS